MNRGLNPLREKRGVLAAGACVVAALGVAGCGGCGGGGGGDDGPGDAKLNLVIGDAIPESGSLAGFGPSARKGSDLAADEINDALDETDSDNTLQVVHADEGQDDVAALDATHKLVKDDGATCLTGPWL